jgi:Delta3-Delta2-enoyl-CoA isomerase
VAAAEDAHALLTVASGRFWASGLDLDWLRERPDEVTGCLGALHGLYARMLELPLVTVAAIQGHAFAAGAMFSLVHDHRVMRADRGYFCLPEVDMGIRFTPALALLLRSRLPQPACHEAMVLGRRFGGEAAERAGIVEAAVGADEVGPVSQELAARLGGKPRDTVAEIRSALYADVIARLRDASANRVEWKDFALAFASA